MGSDFTHLSRALYVSRVQVGQQIGCSILVGNFNLLGLHNARTLLDFSQAMCFPWFSKDLRMILVRLLLQVLIKTLGVTVQNLAPTSLIF